MFLFLTLDHYVKFFTDPDFLLILWRSLVIAVKTTVICLILGYPAAYFYRQKPGKAAEYPDSLYYDSNVDQYAGTDICFDRTSQ